MVEGARLEYECAVHPAPRVRIPPSPQEKLSWSPGRSSAIEFALRVFLTSDSEFRNSTPNPSRN